MIEPGSQVIRATPGAWTKPLFLAGVLALGAVVTVIVSHQVKVERWAVVAFAVSIVCALKAAWWWTWPQTASYDVGPEALVATSRHTSTSVRWETVLAVRVQGRQMNWWTATPGRGPLPLRLLVATTEGGAYTPLPRILLWGRQEFDEARSAVEQACERESVSVDYLR